MRKDKLEWQREAQLLGAQTTAAAAVMWAVGWMVMLATAAAAAMLLLWVWVHLSAVAVGW
jgi:hypothetical protein